MCLPHSNPALVLVTCHAKKRKRKKKSDFVACVCAKKISVLFRPRWLDKISGEAWVPLLFDSKAGSEHRHRISILFHKSLAGVLIAPQERSKMNRKKIKNLWLAFPPPCPAWFAPMDGWRSGKCKPFKMYSCRTVSYPDPFAVTPPGTQLSATPK